MALSNNGYEILHLKYVMSKVYGASDAPWLENLREVVSATKAAGKGVDNKFIVSQDFFEPDILLNFKPSSGTPIGIQDYSDSMLEVSLESVDTKATRVQDEDTQGYAVDVLARVNDGHINTINRTKYRRGQWNLAPAAHEDITSPVLEASGVEVTPGGRRRLIYEDIVALRDALTAQGVPNNDRVLVLCSEHYSDILLDRENFGDLMLDYNSGRIKSIAGFAVYEYAYNPTYTQQGALDTLTKDAWNTNMPGRTASIAFYAKMFGKIRGDVKRYYSPSENDTQLHVSLLNYKHYFYYGPASKHTDSYSAAIV